MDCEGDNKGTVKGVVPDCTSLNWLGVKLLGQGSIGLVHLVMIKLMNAEARLIAVKSSPSRFSALLAKELDVLKEFNGYRNVVQCYNDIFVGFDQDGKPVSSLILEYPPGGTLSNLICNNYGSKIPEADARNYARMLVEGIRDIHQRGWVHCDLKPQNILVYHSDKIVSLKIADFGLARQPGEVIEEPDLTKGPWIPKFPDTAVYMPPESVNAAKIDGSTDIWSLGCVVLQMITAKVPWEYKDKIDLVVKLVSSKSPPRIPDGMSREGWISC